MKFKKIVSHVLNIIAAGAFVGFILNSKLLIKSISGLISNRYLQYHMPQHIQAALNNLLFHWLIAIVLSSIFLFLLWLLWKSYLYKKWDALTKSRVKKISVLTFGFLFLLYLLWELNLYLKTSKFHILSLGAHLAIVALIMAFLILMLMVTDWKTFIKPIRKFSFFFLLVIIFCIFFSFHFKPNPSPEHNVIFIIVDTLRADHLSCYGYQRQTTPNIDKFSQEAILFKNAISPAPWTTPAIASIITSLLPPVLGIERRPVVINDHLLTLAEICKENHYITKAIISHAYVSSVLGFQQGFDHFDEENVQGEMHISSPSITQKAINFLEKNRKKKFFLFLHYFDPHYNFILHDKYNYYPGYKGPLHSSMDIEELLELAPELSPDDIDYLKALYDSEISFTDEHIGLLFDKLKELGLYKDSLIIFTADHGEEFAERGDHWIGHNKTLFRELIHIPLIIKLPKIHEKNFVEEYVGLVDLMPTIINYLGLKMPEKYALDGKALDLRELKIPQDKEIISETRRLAKLTSLTKNGWKIIKNVGKDSLSLFDLNNDPQEYTNLAEENILIFKEMELVLDKWIYLIDLHRPKVPQKQPEFTRQQMRHLRSLGYIK